jgi:DNA-directed RNA polymerase specialized sigma24 family protein
MALTPDCYRDIVRAARRHARRYDEAVDLAHDVIAAALSARVDDWETPSRRAWIAGALRRHAAFVARTEIRRRQRELRLVHPLADPPPAFRWSADFLGSLAPSVRRVAVLLMAGMTRREATYVLGISDAAFRQRLSALRRAARTAPSPLTDGVSDAPDLAVGRLRQWLLASVRRDPGSLLGTHDPDGHLLIVRRTSRNRP